VDSAEAVSKCTYVHDSVGRAIHPTSEVAFPSTYIALHPDPATLLLPTADLLMRQ
jgi:hypothetical protein